MAYGYGTRSWMHSTEYNQLKKERAQVTAAYLATPPETRIPAATVRPQCCCDDRDWPHDPIEVHGGPWPLIWSRRK
jgi:hypothetical protein